MRFEALNLKGTFKVWKLALLTIMIVFTVIGLAYVIIEWPKPSFDPLLGFSIGLNRNNPQHEFIVGLAVALPLVDIGLLIFIRLLANWEKDAAQYGLILNGNEIKLLHNGQQVTLNINDIDRFEVLPKNCEPTVFKSKWTEVGVIIAAGEEHKLYYLKGMNDAKRLFEANKANSIK